MGRAVPGNPLDYWGSDPGNPLSQGAPTWADAVDAYGRLIAQQRQRDIDAGLIDPATGWPTRQGMMQSGLNTALGMSTADAPGGFRAFHGSPYSFDAFDASKIGTGEGAQAYGHGLYFAENEGVAQTYKGVQGNAANDPMANVAQKTIAAGHDATARLKQIFPDASDAEISAAIERAGKPPAGSMYEVNIGSDPAHFLDWDKPLSEQSQHVKDTLLGPLGVKRSPNSEATGQMVYNSLGYGQKPEVTAQQMRDAGIAGIRYLDAGSRGAGQGTSNYVVFDPATIEILRKYGIAGLGLGLGAAATQGNAQQQ